MTVRGDVAYVTDSAYFRPSYLFLLDISDPLAMNQIDRLALGTMIYDVAIQDGYAYLSDNFPSGGTGLYVGDVDAGRSTYGAQVSSVDTIGVDEAVAAITNFVFLGSTDDSVSLRVIDSNDPSNITALSVLDSMGWTNARPKQIVQRGKYLYVADANNGLRIIDALPSQ